MLFVYFPFSWDLSEILKPEIPELQTLTQSPKINLPPPLRSEEGAVGFLTKEGVIKWTNFQREKNGLSPLKENPLLDQSANLKLKDMIDKQYFDHVSPDGIELKDLMEKVGYEFILIGENLAMGNFKDDQDLVLAWMESPGHRENILNERYQEIGVAVGQGIFEGKKVWFAVQHFGKPLSACPQPDKDLKLKIEENKKTLDKLLKEIKLLEAQIKRTKPRWREDLAVKIEQYNNLVSQYNQLLLQTQTLISQYNSQVRIYNECVGQ